MNVRKITIFTSLIAIVFLLLGLGVSGCKKGGKGGTAATINGEDITMDQLDKEFKKVAKQYQGMPQGSLAKEQENRMKKQMMFNLMEEILTKQEAEKNNIEVSEKQINARLKQYQAGRSKKEFQEQLKKSGMTEKDLKEKIESQLLSEKLLEKVVKAKKITEKEMKAYYKKNKKQFVGADKKELPYKEVKPRIKQMLESQKKQEARSDWLDEVKANSDVRLYFW